MIWRIWVNDVSGERRGGEGGGGAEECTPGTGDVTPGECRWEDWELAPEGELYPTCRPPASVPESKRLHGVLTHFSNKTALSFYSLPGDSWHVSFCLNKLLIWSN